MSLLTMPEIGFDHCGIAAYLVGSADRQNFAFGHHHDSRAQRHDELHIVFNHHEGGAALSVDRSEPLFEIGEHGEVDTAGGLIQQHQPRPAHEGHRGIEQFLLTVGQAAGGFTRQMIELEEADHSLRGAGHSGIGRAEKSGHHAAPVLLACEYQVFPHRQFRKYLQQLERSADAEAIEFGWPQAGDDLAVDLHFTAARRELAEDAVEERRLPATIRPDQSEDLAFPHLKADAVDRGDSAKVLADIGDLKDCCHGAASSEEPADARNADAVLVRRSVASRSRMPRMPVGE